MTTADFLNELIARLKSWLGTRSGSSAPLEQLAGTLIDAPLRSLPVVDEHLRSGAFRYTDAWHDLRVTEVHRSAKAPNAWSLLALLASHPNGFVRQAAVRELGDLRDGRVLPFVVLRLNDWVVDVRRAAQAALAGYVSPAFASSLLAILPLVFALERQKRGEHATVVTWVHRTVQSSECRDALLAACESPDRYLRGLAYRLAVEAPDGRRALLLERALRDAEPTIRVWATRQVGLSLVETWAQARARQALSDRSVQVRRVALGVLAQSLPVEEVKTLAEEGLLDENTSARWQARILRLQMGPLDLGAFYRQALSAAETAKSLRGALLGLGESGTREDIRALAPHLRATNVGVRRAAIRALAGLEASSTTEPFMDALRDPLPGISKEGRRALEARLDHLSFERLAALIRSSDSPPGTRRNAVFLAKHLSKWESLPLILDGCAAAEPRVVAYASVLLDGWRRRYNRSFLLPTHAQLDRIDEVFRRVSGQLRRGERQDLEHLVRSARGFVRSAP